MGNLVGRVGPRVVGNGAGVGEGTRVGVGTGLGVGGVGTGARVGEGGPVTGARVGRVGREGMLMLINTSSNRSASISCLA